MQKIILFSVIYYFLISTFLYAVGSDNLQGSNKGWKAGVARMVITPDESLWISGYAVRDHPSEGTLNDLWAKALVIEDARGERAVLITTDLIGFPKNISDRIRDQLKVKFNLSRAQIILNSSHTHSGPVLSISSNIVYPLDSNQKEKIQQYTSELGDKIVKKLALSTRF